MEQGELTRHLKPLKESKFSDFEILQAMIKADIDPEEIASVTQLRGSRSGVIRVAMRTRNSVNKLDELVKRKRLCIGRVALAEVKEGGHFVKVVLENVPLYVSDSDVEEEMSRYGTVISSDKEYQEFEGCRIANERRNILFSNLFPQTSLHKKQLLLRGNVVFATVVRAPEPSKGVDPSYEEILDKIVRQLEACRRQSRAELPSNAEDLQLEPEVLAYLQRRSSLKIRGEKRKTTSAMSSVARRQSEVTRDVASDKKTNAFEIFNWKDSNKILKLKNETKSKFQCDAIFGKKSENDGETENRVGLLKKLTSQKLSRPIYKTSKSAENMTSIKLEGFKSESGENSQHFGKADVKKSGILKQSKVCIAQKARYCNESFNSFLDVRKRQKRNEAFLQLSANLL